MADSADTLKDAAAVPGTPRAGTPEPTAPEPEAEPAVVAEPASGGGDALTAEDIVRWWGHIDREAGEACPHYGRHFCHYLDHEITSLDHGLATHERAACMLDMAQRLALPGEVQSANELVRNLYYDHLCFAKERGFSVAKTLVVFNLLRAHHEASVASGVGEPESRAAFHDALLE